MVLVRKSSSERPDKARLSLYGQQLQYSQPSEMLTRLPEDADFIRASVR